MFEKSGGAHEFFFEVGALIYIDSQGVYKDIYDTVYIHMAYIHICIYILFGCIHGMLAYTYTLYVRVLKLNTYTLYMRVLTLNRRWLCATQKINRMMHT